MKVTLVESSFGILAFDSDNKIVAKALFPRKPQAAASMLAQIEGGKLADEFTQLVQSLKEKGYDTFAFENPSLAKESEAKLGIHVEVTRPTEAGELLRSRDHRSLAGHKDQPIRFDRLRIGADGGGGVGSVDNFA